MESKEDIQNFENKIKLQKLWDHIIKKGEKATWFEIAEALTTHRKVIKMTQGELAKKCRLTQGMISRYEKGTGVIPDWETTNNWVNALELEEFWGQLDFQTYVTGLRVDRNWREDHPNPNTSLMRIPEYNVQASAGYGSFQGFEEVIEYHDIPTKFLPSLGVISPAIIQVVGDSMYPTISSGDHIIVQLDEGYRTDGVYLIRIDDTVHCKRLQRKFGSIRIISDNPLYEEIEVTGDDGNSFAILGKVLTTIKKI